MWQDILTIVVRTKRAYPRIKQLYRLRARFNLSVEIPDESASNQRHHRVPGAAVVVHQRLRVHIVFRGAPFNNVRRKREWRSRKSNQRQILAQRLSCFANRSEDKTQCLYVIDFTQAIHVDCRARWIVDNWSLAFVKFKLQAHRLDDQKNVGKDNCRIHSESFGRRYRNLRSQLRRLAQLKKTHARAYVAIFLHVAARLAHQPDRRVRNGFAMARPHERTLA